MEEDTIRAIVLDARDLVIWFIRSSIITVVQVFIVHVFTMFGAQLASLIDILEELFQSSFVWTYDEPEYVLEFMKTHSYITLAICTLAMVAFIIGCFHEVSIDCEILWHYTWEKMRSIVARGDRRLPPPFRAVPTSGRREHEEIEDFLLLWNECSSHN